MRSALDVLLAEGRVLLADGATGTNYFQMGLGAGEPPELWNVDAPEKVASLHRRFVDAGADIILTNTFGCNRHRLRLHRAEHRVAELAQRAAEIAGSVAAGVDRPVVVAGSVGPDRRAVRTARRTHRGGCAGRRSASRSPRCARAAPTWRGSRRCRHPRRCAPRRRPRSPPGCPTSRPARSTRPGAR